MCGCTRLAPAGAGTIELLTAIAAENDCNASVWARRHFNNHWLRSAAHFTPSTCAQAKSGGCGPIDRAHCTLLCKPQKLRTHNSRGPDTVVHMQWNGRGLAGTRSRCASEAAHSHAPRQGKIAACWPIIQVWALCCPCFLHAAGPFALWGRPAALHCGRSSVERSCCGCCGVPAETVACWQAHALMGSRCSHAPAAVPLLPAVAAAAHRRCCRRCAAGASLAAQLNQRLRRVAQRCYVSKRAVCIPACPPLSLPQTPAGGPACSIQQAPASHPSVALSHPSSAHPKAQLASERAPPHFLP